MSEKIMVCTVRPGEEPVMEEIEDTLEAMQRLVGGYIEVVKPWGNDIALICNEEGKLQNLTPNRVILRNAGRPFDLICGTFFLVMAPRNCDVFMSLPRMMMARCLPLMTMEDGECL